MEATVASELWNNFSCLESWIPPVDGSETMAVDDNVCMILNKILEMIHDGSLPEDITTSDISRPSASQVESYLMKVKEIVMALNDAKVAHMDLRPSNIMWREDDSGIAVQVIDFEDSYRFNSIVPLYGSMKDDLRYPYHLTTDIHGN